MTDAEKLNAFQLILNAVREARLPDELPVEESELYMEILDMIGRVVYLKRFEYLIDAAWRKNTYGG